MLCRERVRDEDLRHQHRHHNGSVSVYFDVLGLTGDLAPRDGFLRARATVAAVVLLSRVDVHGVVRAVSHEVGIARVVLNDTTAENEHARAPRLHGPAVDAADVLHEVDDELGHFVGQDLGERAVGEGWDVDGDAVLRRPVREGIDVVDGRAQQGGDLRWSHHVAARGFDGFPHNGYEFATAPLTELGQVGGVGVPERAGNVNLNAAAGRDEHVHLVVSGEEGQGIANDSADHGAREGNEERGDGERVVRVVVFTLLGDVAPRLHLFEDRHSLAEIGGLEARRGVRLQHGIRRRDHRTRDWDGVVADLFGFDENGVESFITVFRHFSTL
eukprot:PhM_4_TR7202/c0_g1_i1/m.51394